MEKLKFDIKINAPKEKVWKVLWDDKTYREWTSVFTEGSHAESDWKEGSKIKFLDPKGSGMFAVIDKKIDNKQMTFKHLGEIKNGEEVKSEFGEGFESYFLSGSNGQTELKAEMDAPEDFKKYFEDTFPKALQKVKEISEK